MKFYKTDWFMKVASVVAAVAIWFYVVYQENPVYTRWLTNIPVAHKNVASDFENGKLVISSISTEDTDVKINGRRRLVSNVDVSSAQAHIDMSGVNEAGEYNLPVKVDFTIDGADIVQIRPNYCTVVVDRVITKEREINVVTSGNVKEGFVKDNITINPYVVKLTGPQKEISAVSSCRITVDLSDASDDIKGLYKIKFYDERGQEITDTSITKNIEYTDVYCSVVATKEVEILPFLSGETNSEGDKIVAECIPETINVKGKTAALDDIAEISTELIDVSDITEESEIELNLTLPDGVFFADEENKTVKIRLSVEKPVSSGNEVD